MRTHQTCPSGEVISKPFETAAVWVSIEVVFTSVKTARVAPISWTTHFPADWMRFWTAEARVWMNDWSVIRDWAVVEASVEVERVDWSESVVEDRDVTCA